MSIHQQVPVVAGPPPRIEVRNPAGSVTVRAVEGAEQLEVEVEPLDDAAEQLLDRVEVDLRAGDADSPARLRVAVPERRLLRTPAFAVRITTPSGAAARIAVASADVELTGSLGELEVTSASGDVDVEHGTEVHVRTASGESRIGTVEGRASIASASGDIRIGRGQNLLKLRTASGDVSVDHAGDATTIKTASGDVTVGAAAGEMLQVQTASGDISVGVPPGLRVWLDLHTLSGRMSSDLEEEGSNADGRPDLTLTLESVSGRIRIGRTTAAPVV
jgi:DUF4097 and DUF4098 domain-containing protein YvlB